MKTVIIDIGHARHTGAKGWHDLEEHEVNTVVARHLKDMLEDNGVNVVVIDFPDSSNAADLAATPREANKYNADLGVSLHSDCSDNPSAHGGHVCYLSAKGKSIASCIAHFLTELMPGRADGIVKRDNLHVLKATRAPWVLVEGGFISNASDAAVMKYRPEAIAKAVADGILLYLNR